MRRDKGVPLLPAPLFVRPPRGEDALFLQDLLDEGLEDRPDGCPELRVGEEEIAHGVPHHGPGKGTALLLGGFTRSEFHTTYTRCTPFICVSISSSLGGHRKYREALEYLRREGYPAFLQRAARVEGPLRQAGMKGHPR